MKTIYDNTISNAITSEYIDYVINKVFYLLPMFEESKNTKNENSFIIYQNTLIQTINGNTDLICYNDKIIIDILSHLEALKNIQDHADYKRHILKICKLLTSLKEGVLNNGI